MDNLKINILLIEDNPADIRLIKELLKKSKDFSYELESHPRLADGLDILTKKTFDILLLDLSLPDSDRTKTLESVLEIKDSVPIIILTGLDEKYLALESLKKGVQDYLIKGELNSSLLIRSILYAIERHRIEYKKVIKPIEITPLDDKDKEILNILQENCRVSYNELSEKVGLAASTIHNRVQKMQKDGIINGFHAQVDPFKIGFKTLALLGLSIDPLKLDIVAKKIASFDEVQLVAATTGDHDIVAQIISKNEKELWKFINTKIKTIEGVYPQLHVSSFIDTFKMTNNVKF
ncbi:MAG: winged helix-turn-helix transcriptional regulator [Promethearchaeota archaeon]